MAKGVFIHNSQSVYDDRPEEYYNFPKVYLSRAKPTLGDWIIYYESGKGSGRKSYKAIAKVEAIREDLTKQGHYYADIAPNTYLPFDQLVPFKIDGQPNESLLSLEDGRINGGLAISAVRPISEEDFTKIVNLGFKDELDELPRIDEIQKYDEEGNYVSDFGQPEYIVPTPRLTLQTLQNRKVRDRVFRRQVIKAYNKTCAFTGLNFVNGGGRAEVEAAHIRPVAHDGPDVVSNGLALSGTIHWMFDRGYLSISDDHDILVSRHLNNIDEIDRLLVTDRKAIMPVRESDWPHPAYMEWHRAECFKI